MLFIWFACAINQFRRRKKQRMKEEKRNIFRICIYHWLSTSIDNIYIFWFIYGQWKIKIFHTMINVCCPANPNKNLSKCQNTHCLTKNVDLFIRFVSVCANRVFLYYDWFLRYTKLAQIFDGLLQMTPINNRYLLARSLSPNNDRKVNIFALRNTQNAKSKSKEPKKINK